MSDPQDGIRVHMKYYPPPILLGFLSRSLVGRSLTGPLPRSLPRYQPQSHRQVQSSGTSHRVTDRLGTLLGTLLGALLAALLGAPIWMILASFWITFWDPLPERFPTVILRFDLPRIRPGIGSRWPAVLSPYLSPN